MQKGLKIIKILHFSNLSQASRNWTPDKNESQIWKVLILKPKAFNKISYLLLSNFALTEGVNSEVFVVFLRVENQIHY
jgi:hypothetical protein